jgi:hypothetical protein
LVWVFGANDLLSRMTEKGAIFVGDRFLRVWLSLLTVLCVVTFIAVLGVSPSDGGVLLLYDAKWKHGEGCLFPTVVYSKTVKGDGDFGNQKGVAEIRFRQVAEIRLPKSLKSFCN